jgi:hypothetical protein
MNKCKLMQAMEQLVYQARSGFDYDIAKLFMALFPNNTFTDKDISIKLSEDLHGVLLKEAMEWTQRAMNTKDPAHQQHCSELANQYNRICEQLRTHSHKKRFIEEIRMIR